MPQVLSALAVLTTVFGMGTGGTPSLWPPGIMLASWDVANRIGSWVMCVLLLGYA